jgi:hypothetical protein
MLWILLLRSCGAALPPLSSRWRQSKRISLRSAAVWFNLLQSCSCAQHMVTFVAMIFGRYGGPSSRSMAEACLIHCQSSMQLGCQEVRPRCPRGGWWLDLFVGGEPTSNSLLDLGGDAWRSPTFGGGGTHVLDCFLFFSARVLFVI